MMWLGLLMDSLRLLELIIKYLCEFCALSTTDRQRHMKLYENEA